MACGEPPSNYQPYTPRGRWIRTANDSYFVAMTYPEGMPAMLKPSDIHDALWGVLSAVYGGAVHPKRRRLCGDGGRGAAGRSRRARPDARRRPFSAETAAAATAAGAAMPCPPRAPPPRTP